MARNSSERLARISCARGEGGSAEGAPRFRARVQPPAARAAAGAARRAGRARREAPPRAARWSRSSAARARRAASNSPASRCAAPRSCSARSAATSPQLRRVAGRAAAPCRRTPPTAPTPTGTASCCSARGPTARATSRDREGATEAPEARQPPPAGQADLSRLSLQDGAAAGARRPREARLSEVVGFPQRARSAPRRPRQGHRRRARRRKASGSAAAAHRAAAACARRTPAGPRRAAARDERGGRGGAGAPARGGGRRARIGRLEAARAAALPPRTAARSASEMFRVCATAPRCSRAPAHPRDGAEFQERLIEVVARATSTRARFKTSRLRRARKPR